MTYDSTARRTATTEQQSDQQSDEVATEPIEMTTEELLASFPVQKLISLHTKISSPRWVVPVLPEQELECLLNAAIKLSIHGLDQESEPCMRFYKESLTQSFLKILTDDAVNSWKYNIHHCILMSCGKLLHLCALHMKHDNSYLLDLLAIVFDPENKFHTHNAQRQPELFNITSTTSSGSSVTTLTAATTTTATSWGVLNENQIFARSPSDPRNPRGWLVDLINRFGQHGGFENLLERFNIGIALIHNNKKRLSATTNESGVDLQHQQTASTSSLNLSGDDLSSTRMKTSTISSNGGITNSTTSSSMLLSTSDDVSLAAINKLTLPIIYLLIRPFGQCYELLTEQTIEKYFMNIWEIILELLENLSDDELKREAKLEGKNDTINGIVKAARCLISRIPNQENLVKDFEMCRLKIILRVLQTSSFNGKMNALNEINKVLGYVSYYPHRSQTSPDDDVDYLTADKMAKWIKDTNVLSIVLRDSLHQPQYVEKLEKILRFLIKEKALSLDDLDAVWRAQAGKHEAIVKNVHDLLAKLAWDFDAEQLDHLFECFQASMKTANKKQRERLLELNRRLAEDDKNGVMAHKVLKLFWSLAHSADVPPEVLDQALASHVKILDYSCSQERDAQKTAWLDKCVEELKSNDNWVLPALRLIREICCLYEATPNHAPRTHQSLNRQQVIERLQNEHTLVILVTNSLTSYMDQIRALVEEQTQIKPNDILMDKRYPHPQQIQERLDFLKFLLKDGQLWLCADQAKQIWQCLAVNAAFATDREECFRWFGKLMGDEPDLDPHINKDFFENNILQLDPKLLTESGIKCFERFFKAVNSNVDKLKAKQRGYVLDDENLIGKDYLWRVITTSGDDISYKAIELLKEVSTALGPRLQATISEFHGNFIDECCDKLRTHYEMIIALNIVIAESEGEGKDCKDIKVSRLIEAEKMCRIIRVLQEYIKECDRGYTGERLALPLARASRGKHITIYLRFQNHSNRPMEDLEVVTHSNETIVSFKRNLQKRLKGAAINNIRIDLYSSNGELIEIADERHPLSQYNIRDKTFTVKLTPIGPGAAGTAGGAAGSGVMASSTAAASSPDSSSDSSTGSPPRPCPDMQRSACEMTLPGVIISKKPVYKEFFIKLYQLGSDLQHGHLRECSRALLHLLPLDKQTIRQLHAMCRLTNPVSVVEQQKLTPTSMPAVVVPPTSLEPIAATCTAEYLFLTSEPASVLYNLEVLHAILIPALEPLGEPTLQLQSAWLHSGGAHFILDLLTKNNFLTKADMHTKRAAYQCVLRLVKLFLYIVGCVLSRVGDEPAPSGNTFSDGSGGCRSQVEILKQALTSFPGNSEHTLRASAAKLAQSLAEEMLSAGEEGDRCRKLFDSVLQWQLPDITTIKAIVQLAWVSSIGNIQLLGRPNVDLTQETSMPEAQDFAVCKEALEVLSISLVLNHTANDALSKDPQWNKFISSIVLVNPSRHIRQNASEQLFLTCTYCASDRRPFTLMIVQLVATLHSTVPKYSASCSEFFQLLCRILNYGCMFSWPLPVNDGLLSQEICWLRKIRETVKLTGETQVHDDLLEGRLCLTKELMFYLNPDLKSQLSSLITELVDDFLFPSSRQYLQLRRTGQISDCSGPPPVCRNPHTIAAACDLLVALCQNSVPNMKMLVTTLIDMFCSTDTEALREWEYLPPVGPRPSQGFCGLKNAGATCYMNSVLQQLFMVPLIRVGILSAAGAATDPNEDFSGEADSSDLHVADDGSRNNNYHVGILKYVQAIFAHLGHSSLQFYVPRGLWSHFKLQGEPVNLREQQDAVEFFMSLFESLDEGLKALGHPQLMGATLGGCFSDQKICQGCPHRYSKDEPFSVFSVDIRNHSSLTDSLEQYVKGELLEGADAYHCDKCDKKVVTVKRLCVRKLPPVLAIQLKRFEYDYERVCAIKFNDYFEFPRWLDMEPYTVSGLAKLEGEVIDIDEIVEDQPTTTKYQLTGIVVHSGQASGGHYFSYILHKNQNGTEQWYKFDDGEVTECKMHEDEEMKAQCFGGDYMGEVYDNNLKRMQYRRQKRWWNAYMLFYTRCDQQPVPFKQSVEQLALSESKNCVLPMSAPIEKSVRSQNIRFLHARSLFSTEFFTFIRKLVSCSVPSQRTEKLTQQAEDLSLLGIQLASQFLFHSGFRTKKQLRGAAIDWYEELKIPVQHWYDTLCQHIRHSSIVRRWFANNVLLNPHNRLGEYILIAPSPEVRTVFVKLVVFFCHFAINDDPLPGFDGVNLCEQILIAVLSLLKCEVSEHGKHLPHYFSLFSMYAGLGIQEKHQLLKLNVPAIFMKVALDEGPGPPIKFQYPDLSKLHQVVSHLVRSSDISSKCQNSMSAMPVLPNDYIEPNIPAESLIPLSAEAIEYLFNKTSYIKKLIEDANIGEEGLKLLQYCSWENPHFSRALLKELLWSCGFAYWHDMRHYTELLLNILLIKDSWHHHRIHNAIMGVSEEREGLLDTIQRNKSNYQKRAYQCIKCLVQLFTSSRDALDMLHNNPLLARQWTLAVEWLQDELDRQRGVTQYNYSSWSPPAPSNENTNNYTIERSASAKSILQMAFALCPEEEQEEASDELEALDEPPPLISGTVDTETQYQENQQSTSTAKVEVTKNSNMTLQYVLQNYNDITSTTTLTTTAVATTTTAAIIKPLSSGGDGDALTIVTSGITQLKISPMQISPSTIPSDSNSSTDTTSTHIQTTSSSSPTNSPTSSTAIPDTAILLVPSTAIATTTSTTTTNNPTTTTPSTIRPVTTITTSTEQT